jgi:hypothetical protein
MSVSLVTFPQRHAGLILGTIMSLGLLFCLGAGGDPSVLWGVSQVYPEIGVEPFAEARGLHLGIESGLENPDQQPLLTSLAMLVFHFFGHGNESRSLFSILPYMLCIFTVALLIAQTRGRIFGLLGGGWLALQPTFLAWSSVPSTVPFAALVTLLLVAVAGQPQRWAPWFAFVVGGTLSWGLSPLITVVLPICWIEGVRRELPTHWQPGGWSLLALGFSAWVTLLVAGIEPEAIARTMSGISEVNSAGAGSSLISIDPGLVLILTLALFIGFRKPQAHLRPLTGLLVTAFMPWVLAGEMPIFPLVVLMPSVIWLVTETFADRSRVKILNIDRSGRGIRESLVLFLLGWISVAVVFISQEKSANGAFLSSVSMAICIVGALLGLRAGFRNTLVGWISVFCLASFLLPVNLNRMAHSTDRWEVARSSLDRLIPQGEAVAGPWAHMMVMGTDRPAFQKLENARLHLSERTPRNSIPLEKYHCGNRSITLYRASGKPGSLYEEAVHQQVTGNSDQARQSLSMILRVSPDCSSAWERLGLILLQDGHEDLASECFFFALQDDVWRPVSHQQLSRLYSKYGLFREARYHLEMSQGPDSGMPPSLAASVSLPDRR